jgi:thioredoxin reductase
MNLSTLPIAVIGAGPVGLAAAAHLVSKGETPIVIEAGPTVGASMLDWGHVQLFSPWQYNVDVVATGMLEAVGWKQPAADAYPTGRELVEQYLAPLAALPQLQPHIRLGARVTAITRQGFDKMKTDGRDQAPFVLRVATAAGDEEEILAKAVIDASGTYRYPNPLGASGLPAIGERALADRIFYGIPDLLGAQRARYAGKRVLVVGSGHSAFNALLDLAELAQESPDTTIVWAIRRAQVGQLYGGGANDLLPARGELGERLRQMVADGLVQVVTGVTISALRTSSEGIRVASDQALLPPVDEIIATTGFRPNLAMLAELRLGLDAAVESPTVLAPLIDPNLHSCGTVRPHGAEELAHPEPGFYIVGMKSYGRAPTFLLLTGYEQVRSVVCALTGDLAGARDVQLILPETGVCSTDRGAGAGCCSPVVAAPTAGVTLELVPLAAAPRLGQVAHPVQLLSTAATGDGCCAPAVQSSCCAQEAKATCCGEDTSAGCGCQ